MKQPNFKDLVKKGLTKKELEHLKTAFDIVGDIAILEIDEVLRKKELFIAKTLMKCHKNVMTVLRKDSAHEGEFRVQKMKHLTGEKNKETIHIESGCRLKLDVEQVYFSPRMGHERLRIVEQVKEGENILCLFSGCGPYPVVLARNTKAKFVTGIEINPVGHKYAVENARLSKKKNIFLFNGDARAVVDSFYQRRIGMKGHHTQLTNLLKQYPPLMELHMHPDDMNNLPKIGQAVEKMQSKNIEVVLHTPFYINDMPTSLATKDSKFVKNTIPMLKTIQKFCTKHKIRYVMHPHTRMKGIEPEISLKILDKNLAKYRDSRMLIENMPYDELHGIKFAEVARKNNARLCIDIAHLYTSRKDDEEFYDSVRQLSEYNPYFHIADSDLYRFDWKKPHTLPLGDGDIDFTRIVPYVNEGIIEVYSEDFVKGTEMIQSYKKYNKMLADYLKFDRITMPLPRNAEDFLDVALNASHKGTVIHFYDFLHVDDFDLAKEKIDKACKGMGKKYKILDLVKCGQYSPRTYRICVDFVIK